MTLIQTIQERLAKICEKLAERRFEEHGTREPDTNATYYGGRDGDELSLRDEEDEYCAAAIRAADLSDLEPKEGATPRTESLHKRYLSSGQFTPDMPKLGKKVFWDFNEQLVAAERELAALTARLEAKEVECARLRLPPQMTLSDHPGCAFCMEAGTPVRPGEVCPECGDRLPTKREQDLQSELTHSKNCTAMMQRKAEAADKGGL